MFSVKRSSPGEQTRNLIGRTVMIVKICGITSPQDARLAIDAGADWIGINLVGGPRKVNPALALNLVQSMDQPERAVALMRIHDSWTSPSWLVEMRRHGVRRLQVYGAPQRDQAQFLAAEGFDIIRVMHIAPASERSSETDQTAPLAPLIAEIADFPAAKPAYVLLDTASHEGLGGTGIAADWHEAARICRQAKDELDLPLLLAGGLTSENVASAIKLVSPAGVDVSSGVESKPGQKDAQRLRDFIAAARVAAAQERPR